MSLEVNNFAHYSNVIMQWNSSTKSRINEIAYQLYELTETEIKIVENK